MDSPPTEFSSGLWCNCCSAGCGTCLCATAFTPVCHLVSHHLRSVHTVIILCRCTISLDIAMSIRSANKYTVLQCEHQKEIRWIQLVLQSFVSQPGRDQEYDPRRIWDPGKLYRGHFEGNVLCTVLCGSVENGGRGKGTGETDNGRHCKVDSRKWSG